jgi:hypothetical protein
LEGCCFDYGNSSTNGRAVGTGTMETTYFGIATAWGSGQGPGHWIMADMEAGLFSGYNAKQNVTDPTIDSWRFVTAVVDGVRCGDGDQHARHEVPAHERRRVAGAGQHHTLDRALVSGHPYGAAVVNPQATAMGYQGPPAPSQWFGGAVSTRAGPIAPLDASGVAVVDAIVYGSQQSSSSGNGTIASPELATLEDDQGMGGCIVVVPGATGGTGRSRGRFLDGFDADSNCAEFLTQAATTLPGGSDAGATNIKVGSAPGLGAGHTITIANGAALETAVVVSTTVVRGGGTITVAAPLALVPAAGAEMSGTGITLTALTMAHASWAPVAGDVPTPGGPNRYPTPAARGN